jgi:WD40 repeat protein
VEITTDSQYLVTIGDDSQIKLWNRDGQLVRVFQVGERTYEMDISPLHNHIAGITDQGLTIWNFNGAVFKTLTAGGMFRFAPEQSLIAVQENKNKLILYDYEQDTIMHEFIYQQADGDIVSFSFSTDGKYLVLLYGAVEWEVKAHKIDVVDTQTGEKVNTIQFSPDKGIIKVELGIDNNFLIIITNEHALQILNLSTEKSLYITNFDDGHWVVYDEDYHFDCSPNGGQHVGLIKGINPLPSAEYDAFYRPGLFNQFLRGE